MLNTFDITDDSDIEVMSKAVLARFVMEEKPLMVKVYDLADKKTDAQTNLYHLWMGEIGDELGHTKDEMKDIYKEKFMLNLYVNNDLHGYKEVANSMKVIRNNSQPEYYMSVRKVIIDNMSHTELGIKLMREYLTSIKHHAQCDLHIILTDPSMQGLL